MGNPLAGNIPGLELCLVLFGSCFGKVAYVILPRSKQLGNSRIELSSALALGAKRR
jgi:hypothetical protein